MSKLLLRFDKKLKQVMLIEGWEDTYVDDLNKVVVLSDFTFDDIKYTKDTEIKGFTVFYDMRMTQRQIDQALIEYLSNKMEDFLGQTKLIRGTR